MDTAYDFEENNKRYNLSQYFQIDITLQKTCYFPGEIIKGKMKIVPKDLVKKNLLLCPIIGNIILEENHNYKISSKTDVNKEVILFKYPRDLPKFDGNKMIEGMEVDFECEIPKIAHPSCLIDDYTYVRHILTFDFTTIEARKSILIIIKNEQYFTGLNELYKSPAEASLRTSKHKYAIFYMGEISANLKLFKNTFSYNEPIPYNLDIDCSTLTIKIQKLYVSLILTIKKNNKNDNAITDYKIEKKIMEKSIALMEDKKKYHLEDIIQMPKTNPSKIYKKLDEDNRRYSQKFKNVFLCPSCYDGLISCEYSLRLMFETNTLFSTNEYLNMVLDFYESDKDNKNENNDFPKDMNNLHSSTPMGSNLRKSMDINININNDMNIVDKPLARSNTGQNKEVNNSTSIKSNTTFNKKDNNINNDNNNNKNEINLNPKKDDIKEDAKENKNEIKNDNIIINNENNIGKNDAVTDGFEAPPSIFYVQNEDQK